MKEKNLLSISIDFVGKPQLKNVFFTISTFYGKIRQNTFLH